MVLWGNTKTRPLARAGVDWSRWARDAYAAIAVLWIGLVLAGIFVPNDPRLWWEAGRLPDPYAVSDYAAGVGFYYSPPVALVMAPFTLLPFPVFGAALTALSFASLYYLAGPWAIVWLACPLVFWELWAGNIALALAATSLAMLRRPALGAFLVLTKVTPGVGLVWFAVRREWRELAIALGVTGGLLLLTAPLAPGWISSLAANSGATMPRYFAIDVPLMPRLVAAVVLIAWGAWTDRRWVLPIAVTIAVPVLWLNALAGLVGVLGGVPEAHRPAASAPAAARRRVGLLTQYLDDVLRHARRHLHA